MPRTTKKSKTNDDGVSARPKRRKTAADAIDRVPHATHEEDLVRLKRIRGQIEGVERMISEGRYCLDIVNQIRSSMAALRSVENLVMERHVRHCVKDAIDTADRRLTESKVNELIELYRRS